MANPQKENGYTAIANDILERLISSCLNGTELAIVLHIIRKTYGFNKKEDEISLSQFLLAIPVCKQTIVSALKNLQLVKIIRLVKKGKSKINSNLWVFNKDFDTWQLVKKYRLVKVSKSTSLGLHNQLVKVSRHTKDTIQKTITKDTISKDIEQVKKEYGNENINWLLKEFEDIMKFKSAGTKDRFMAKHLLNNFSREQLTAMLTYCSTNEYAPRIGSVEKMWYKRGDIIAGIKSTTNKSNLTIIG